MAALTAESWWRRELTGRKLFFWIFWWGVHWGLFAYGWYSQYTNERLAALNGLRYSVWISRGAGLVLAFDGGLILLPMCRNVVRVLRPKITFLPLDESQWLHRQTAYSMLLFTIIHTCAHYVNFFNVEKTQVRPVTALNIHYAQAGGVTGHVMLLCMVLMFTTAHKNIRHQCFEAFWYTHHLFIIFMIGLYTHATGCFVRDSVDPYSPFAGKPFWNHCIGYQGWRFTIWAGGLYMAERLWREYRSRRQTEITKVVRHPYNAMEIQFKKPSMTYKSGQWLFLQVPAVSAFQWHPFTITSCPSDPYISVHIRQVGDFTKQLAEILGVTDDGKYAHLDPMGVYEVAVQNGSRMPALKIDGPYGAPAEDVFNNEIAVLVGTGIGVTPWASILKNIWHKRNNPGKTPMRLRRVEFIWVCRDMSSFEWFQNLLKSLERQQNGIDGDFLRIHTYLTQKLDMDTAQNIVLNSVGTEVDPLTQLRTGTQFGRPDFPKIFTAIREGINNRTYLGGLDGTLRTNVGVYFCGPSVAARDIKRACKRVTTAEVEFSFWKEHF
ncbi:ferric reductase NAD binding domain-containing protein [Tricharina praecox]|uniref:ferric reductase NAD binding domain-containing protein n=1 Tax=Tricharina praecox TaxID=43433 RepID=UPI002220D4E9|nr:ferric reductase NAD binding domain-containing protein [Tricharina praecox]KAI5850660.1 ferric reductase NAD binding domain-containing protein [Tricharina praecox]